MSIDKTILQYREMSQLQEYAQAQNVTILQLSKKVQKLEDERNHLKTLLESSVPIIKSTEDSISEIFKNDTEYISHMEIAKLKDVSKVRELTYEEAKRLDIYYKLISQIEFKRGTLPEKEVKQLETKDLLKLVETDGNGSK